MATQNLQPGDEHYRAYVGYPERYDAAAAMQFNLLTMLGLEGEHRLLDIGCGSLRAGRLFIPYLQPGQYHGIEPNSWLIEDGLDQELGRDIVAVKQPRFDHNDQFDASVFDTTFDYVIAQSIFSHAPAQQVAACMSSVQQVLEDDGMFLATFLVGTQDHDGTDWVYPGCVTYRPGTVRDFARDAGLDCVVLPWQHVDQQTWFAFLHPDARPDVRAFGTTNLSTLL